MRSSEIKQKNNKKGDFIRVIGNGMVTLVCEGVEGGSERKKSTTLS